MAPRRQPGVFGRLLRAHPVDRPVRRKAAGIQRVSDRAAACDDGPPSAQSGVDPADPQSRPRRPRGRRTGDRSVRRLRDGKQLRHRDHRLLHPGDRQLRGHHQGLRAHRRGFRPVHPRLDARKADGDRRRPLGGTDRRGSGAGAAPGDRGREQLLRRDGRRRQVRPRRRHRRPVDHLHQRHRRDDHRRRPDGSDVSRRGGRIHAPHRRRRADHPGPGAHRLDRGRLDRHQGQCQGLHREGAVSSARRPAEGAGDELVPAGGAGGAAGDPTPAVSAVVANHRRARLACQPGPRPSEGGGASRRRNRGSRAGARGADFDGPAHRRYPLGAGVRIAVADQRRRRRPQTDRSDQGAAPAVGGGGRLRHAERPYPGQHAARRQQLHHPGQGDRSRAKRAQAHHAPGHGPAGGGDHPPRRKDPRADLRPAGDMDRRHQPRRGAVPRLHRGRPVDGGHHPPDRGDQGQHGRHAVLRRDPQAARRDGKGSAEAGRRPDPQPDLIRRRPAGAPEPVGRADLDP